MTNLMVFDFSVFCYGLQIDYDKRIEPYIGRHTEKLKEIKHPLVTDQVREIAGYSADKIKEFYFTWGWFKTFYRGPEYLSRFPYYMIAVQDRKPYWRSKFATDYKGGRKAKSPNFHSARDIGEKFLKYHNIPSIALSGYEADDIAAHIVKYAHLVRGFNSPWSSLENLYLWTVDSDWLQLVSDPSQSDLNVVWLNTGPWEPLVRDFEGALVWCKKKFKKSLEHPQDIVAIKSIEGDKSDNLPPGTPPELIDLLNPSNEFRLTDNPSFNLRLEENGLSKTNDDLPQKTWLALNRNMEYLENWLTVVKSIDGGIL